MKPCNDFINIWNDLGRVKTNVGRSKKSLDGMDVVTVLKATV
mgnify:CR=1 FL=1